MNTESEITKGQEVWVKAIINEKSMHRDSSWFLSVAGGDYAHVPEDEIYTTEQILQKHGASSPQHNAIKYEYTMTLNGDFAIYQVLKYTATETEAMKELNRLNREASHFAKETPQNAVLAEPDRNRRFKKGDKVRLVERWGRPLREGELFESWAFEPNKVYEVLKDEKDNEVELTNGEYSWDYPFYFLDLVEPAPAPKYWVHESPKTYSIYYKGQFGRVITAMLMQKDLYTLKEAQEQCDKLNQK